MSSLNIFTVKKPRAPISEAYRTLRTNIQFSSFDEEVKSILVTSSMPGEGKSTTSSNLAVVTAETGKRTIIIDCDQRKPNLHKVFNLSNELGLSDYLAGQADLQDVLKYSGVKNLTIITSGTKPPNPAELLNSQKMKEFIEELKEEYDFVILDTPPVGVVTDAQILSRIVDGCMLVVCSGDCDKRVVLRAKELLKKVGGKLIGVVLNKVDTSQKGYYGTYYYYYEEGAENTGKKKRKKHRISEEEGVTSV